MKIDDIIIKPLQADENIGYFALLPQRRSEVKIENMLRSIGWEDRTMGHPIHITTMYSADKSIPTAEANKILDTERVYDDLVVGELKVLGYSVVVTFTSPKIQKRFKELSKKLKHSYDDLIPHISLGYFDSPEIATEQLESIMHIKDTILNAFEGIVMQGEYFESLDGDND